MSSYGDVIIIFPYVYPISHSSPILSSHTIFLLSHHLPRFSLIFIIHPILLPLSPTFIIYPMFDPMLSSHITIIYPIFLSISHRNIFSKKWIWDLWCIPYFSHTFPDFFPISVWSLFHVQFIPYFYHTIFPYVSISIIYLIYLPYVLSIIYYLLSYPLSLIFTIYCIPYVFHLYLIMDIW